jgi:hypothetical protein
VPSQLRGNRHDAETQRPGESSVVGGPCDDGA